jgi:Flp pilus assembly protein TadD
VSPDAFVKGYCFICFAPAKSIGIALYMLRTALTMLLRGTKSQRFRKGGVKEALWRDVIQESPSNTRALTNHGLALIERGDYAGAEGIFNKADRLIPDSSRFTSTSES